MARAITPDDWVEVEVQRVMANLPVDAKISDDTVRTIIQTTKRKYPKGTHPRGTIHLRAAERKYKVGSATISRWIKQGFLIVVSQTANEKYVDEALVARLVTAYKADPGRGKRTLQHLFSADT